MANYADVEDQAVKLSVEEQMQITTIQTMEKDVDSGAVSYLPSLLLLLFVEKRTGGKKNSPLHISGKGCCFGGYSTTHLGRS